MLRGSLDGRGNLGKNGYIWKYGWPLCCPPETITTLFIGYSQHKIQSLKKNDLYEITLIDDRNTQVLSWVTDSQGQAINQLLWAASTHVRMWELDHKEGWVPNWCFQTVVLEKTFESPLESKEIQPVHPKGNQPWIFIGRTDAEAPILWPPDGKTWLTRKEPDAGKDWGQEEKWATEDEMVGRHYWLTGHEFEQTLGDREAALAIWEIEHWRAAVYGVTKSWTWLSDWTTWAARQKVSRLLVFYTPLLLLLWVQSLDQEDLQKEMATYSSILDFPGGSDA